MATPSILSTGSSSGAGTAGVSRNDLQGGETVTLSDEANSGGTYLWTIVDQPKGATATLSSTTAEEPTFTVTDEKYGSYTIRCTHNGSESATVIIAYPLPNSSVRIPAKNERAGDYDDGSSDSWHDEITDMWRWTDDNAGGVTDHGDLTGKGDDDHTQYLLVSGSRAMSGGLNMGGNAITNVGNVDGVDVSSHASRHINGGSDVIDGDRIQISWTPTNFTRDNSPSETTQLSDLTAYLAGIDNELADIVTDHGALSGLSDNDHPQYLLLSGGTMTGQLQLASGSAGAPGLAFGASTNTGVRLSGSVLVWNVAGTDSLVLAANQLRAKTGSVSAPGVAESSDTNTGMWWPSGDALAFSTGGTEAGRFDPSQNFQVAGSVRVGGDAGSGTAGYITLTDVSGIGNGSNLDLKAPAIGTSGNGPSGEAFVAGQWIKVYIGTDIYWLPAYAD